MRARIILTLKQHRFETVAVTIVCVGLTLAALIEAFRLNSLNVPLSCLQTYQGGFADPSRGPITAAQAHCNELAKSFFDTKGSLDMNLVQLLLLFAPLLAGIVVGRRWWPGRSNRGRRHSPGLYRAPGGAGFWARFWQGSCFSRR